MAISRSEYEELIDDLEDYADENPSAYRWQVGGLIGLGYGYLVAILVGTGAVLIGMLALFLVHWIVAIKIIQLLGIPLALSAWTVVRAMRVPIEAPDGRRLGRDEAPEFFESIDAIRDQLDAPYVHEVVVNEECNAAIVQVPRLGLFGWPRNYLVVGLPLMEALSPDEFEAVVAHEFGHLSGHHGWFGSWVYRTRQTWHQLKATLEAGYGPPFLFGKFVDWFIPYFEAYSFVLARSEEYEADACSAEVAGARTAGRALARVAAAGEYVGEEFYRKLEEQWHESPEAPKRFVREISEGVREAAREEPEPHLARAMGRRTDLSDTHPSLSERLEALGVESPDLDVSDQPSAARALLGDNLDDLVRELSVDWYTEVQEEWQLLHERAQQERDRLTQLEARLASGEELTVDEEWERAVLVEQFEGDEHARELYEAFVEAHPDDPRGHFELGRRALDEEDDAGLERLERAAELDASYEGEVASLAIAYLRDQGRDDEADGWLERLEAFHEKVGKAEEERNTVDPTDTFSAPDIDDEVRNDLEIELAGFEIDEAYLVAKETEHFPEQPFHVLGIVSFGTVSGFRTSSPEAFGLIVHNVRFPEETLVYDLGATGKGKKLLSQFRDIDGARLDLEP